MKPPRITRDVIGSGILNDSMQSWKDAIHEKAAPVSGPRFKRGWGQETRSRWGAPPRWKGDTGRWVENNRGRGSNALCGLFSVHVEEALTQPKVSEARTAAATLFTPLETQELGFQKTALRSTR